MSIQWIYFRIKQISSDPEAGTSSLCLSGGTEVQWLTLSPHGKKVRCSRSGSGCFCVEFTCSPCVCVGSLWVLRVLRLLPQSSNMKTGVSGSIGDSKSPVGLNVSVDGCMSVL